MVQVDKQPLGQYRWQKRLVVMFVGSDDRRELQRQRQALSGASDGVLDRDLVVVAVINDSVEIDGVVSKNLTAARLRQAYKIPPHGFHVLLIGKDGGIKLRSGEPVTVEHLFAVIDAMPMRRREMQEGRGANR